MWIVFLMLATGVSLIPMVLSGQMSGDVYRPAARVMVVLVSVGLHVMWPVLRASQDPQSARPVADVVRDLGVLVLPAMLLVWPQAVLAGWSVRVVGAVSVVLVSWCLVSGSVLMCWHRFSRGGTLGRVLVSGAVVGISGFVPLALAGSGVLELGAPGPRASHGWMWSPITGVWEILRDRPWSGVSAAVFASHWWALRAIAVVSSGLFVAVVFVCRGDARAESSVGVR